MPQEGRTCVFCPKPVTSRHPKAKYCSRACNQAAHKASYGSGAPKLPTPTVGAISELIASIDLMSKGFAVFRALSAACPCDLAVLVGNRLIRVEVRTADLLADGTVSLAKIGRPYDLGRQDVFALVEHGKVHYIGTDGKPYDGFTK